jgi:hypothetical protein
MRTTPVDVAGLTSGVAAIATGVTACALTTGGGVKCWGDNHVGQLGDGSTVVSRNTPGDVPGLNGVVGISTLGGSVCAVLGDTRVKCWGQNARGQLGNPGAAGYESTPVFVVISLAAQSISFPPLPARNLSAGAFTPTATSTSGLAVTFRSLTTSICSASGSTVTPLAIGICRIAADQAGDKLDWAPASSVLREFLVTGTAAGAPPRLANISTRMQVQLGDNVLIAGFAIYGNSQKTVVIRARGPSLASVGVSNVLADPQLQLYSGQTPIGSNDDWQTSGSATTLQEIGLAPSDPREPAFVAQLNSGLYTVIVRGAQATTGVATIEVFEIDNAAAPLVNLSTRGLVLTGDDVMIAGFIIHGNDPQTVVVNVAGPSLGRAGLSNTLADPTLTLVRSADNTIIATNDNWVSAPNASQIQASGFAPGHSLEPAIMMTLAPGAYTAIVRGVGGGTGIALVGVFAVP